MKFRKGFWLLFILVFALQGCRVYRDVEFKGVKETRFTSFNAQGVSCEFDVEVYNPNPYKITLMQSDVNLFLEGTLLGKVQLPESAVLHAETVPYLSSRAQQSRRVFRRLLEEQLDWSSKKTWLLKEREWSRLRHLWSRKQFR